MIGTILNKPINRIEYINLTTWCDSNNATIEDRGDYYEVIALPEPEPVSFDEIYSEKVVELIRQRYSQDNENAILRKKLAGIDSGEFEAYNNFCEECKAKARAELETML